MLDWTGERFLPWLDQSTIAYEHLHRYAYAATYVKGKRVLDLASGEGYGSKMMSDAGASSVTGIDIDENAVGHATARYGSANAQFLKGSISAVPVQGNHLFDVIVCFEAIEHIEDHDQLLKEVKRLLKPDGIFIVSTPNKLTYHDEAREENPYHMKELYFDEFQKLLTGYFRNVTFLGQRVHPSSSIWPIGKVSSGVQELVIQRSESEFEFISGDKRIPMYFIALATDSTAVVQASSVLIDESDKLLHENKREVEWRDETIASLRSAEKWHEERILNQEKTIASLEEAANWRGSQIGDLNRTIEELNKGLEWFRSQVADLKEKAASDEKALEWRMQQVEALEKERAELFALLQSTQKQVNAASQQLEAIHASTGWKLILRVRHFRDRVRRLTGPATSPGQQ
jgi:ubiquinone/menaquinone biosynthesis C-methylase UbiE